MSLPRVSPGPPPTDVQKQYASPLVQLRPMIVVFASFGSKYASGLSQVKTAFSVAKLAASHGCKPKSTVGGACTAVSSTFTSLPANWKRSSSSWRGKNAALAERVVCT